MKKLKMLAAFAVAAAMAMGMTACSEKPAESNPPAEGETEQEGQDETGADAEGGLYHIGVIQQMEHAALDQAYEGFASALADNGYDESKVEIDFQNAQGDQSNLKTISQRFVNNNVDLILAIATSAAQSVANETSEIPILVTAVTDLVGAELIQSNEAPGTNVSGTSDLTPVKLQFDLLKEILPDAKTVGIMYTSSEVNSEIQAEIAMQAATDIGMAYEIGTITNVNDIPQAVQSIAGKVDVIYIPTDNNLASAMANVASLATEAGIPVIVGESGMCQAGGLATVGIDYYKLGYQTGLMAIEIMNGADVSTMAVQYADDASIDVNLDTAKALNLEIPQSILDEAVNIYETAE